MLAAVSHDLRAPITSLRLHAEFVEDEETRAKIVARLATARSMIRGHGGDVRLENRAEGGLRATAVLPGGPAVVCRCGQHRRRSAGQVDRTPSPEPRRGRDLR